MSVLPNKQKKSNELTHQVMSFNSPKTRVGFSIRKLDPFSQINPTLTLTKLQRMLKPIEILEKHQAYKLINLGWWPKESQFNSKKPQIQLRDSIQGSP